MEVGFPMTFTCDGCCFPIKRKKEAFVTASYTDGTKKNYHVECAPTQFRVET